MKQEKIRQPIVTIAGHVDHGKTTILDCIRGSCIAEGEAGGITQKISFTLFPANKIRTSCPLIDKQGIKLEIPGFLFIDTPGHAAFSNLRKRGGSLADLAVLVVDINEGIKPQTAEVIQILKINKTPFIIALNKIDNISGWRKDIAGEGKGLKENIESQAINIKNNFDEKLLTFIGALQSHGFESDVYYNVKDFTSKIALIPCSGKTGEGMQELMLMLCGLSQRFLKDKLKLEKNASAKGVILEIKEIKSVNYAESILYDGELNKKDELVVANFDINAEPIISKIRILEEIRPLSDKFETKEKVKASTGIRMQLTSQSDILPGMPFQVLKGNLKEIKKEFKKELEEQVKLDKKGIIAKADSLGSLEALLILLRQANIKIVKAGIGNINKTDVINAKANIDIDPLDAVVLGFNVSTDEDAKELLNSDKKAKDNIKVITDDIVYKLIENLEEFRKQKKSEIEKQKIMALAGVCKLEILQNYVFRNSNPAVFGVRVLGGKLKSGISLINNMDEEIGKIKNIQSENKSVNEVGKDMEVAVSLSGVNFERQLKDVAFLYSDLSESQFRKFKENKELLSQDEIKTLQEIAEIKRKKNLAWGV